MKRKTKIGLLGLATVVLLGVGIGLLVYFLARPAGPSSGPGGAPVPTFELGTPEFYMIVGLPSMRVPVTTTMTDDQWLYVEAPVTLTPSNNPANLSRFFNKQDLMSHGGILLTVGDFNTTAMNGTLTAYVGGSPEAPPVVLSSKITIPVNIARSSSH